MKNQHILDTPVADNAPSQAVAHASNHGRRQILAALAVLGAGPLIPARASLAATLSVPIYGNFRGASLGLNANLNGAVAFPAGHALNKDISLSPVDPNSAAIIRNIGSAVGLHPDFGSAILDGSPIGIPYVVVSGTAPKTKINITASPGESDLGFYPVPRTAPIEGGANSAGDRHVLVLDRDNQRLYELYRAFPLTNGTWSADSSAVFYLDSMNIRPTAQPGWTSADAAGLPILPGLVRYEEASKGPGGIQHALRFTVPNSRRAYVPPATHFASSNTSTALPPMGARLRLRASFVIPSTFSTESKAILTALKTYGMIVADNGSAFFLTGAPDPRWNDDALVTELRQVKGSDFEVIRMDGLVTA